MINRTHLVLPLLLLVGLALNILTILTWDPLYISNDGVQYLSTAENWLKGNGFSTNALIYSPHFQGILPAPQTVWPPGFPLAIALLSKLGLSLKAALLILNLIMHTLASVLMWRIFLKLGMEHFFSMICAFLFYFMALPWAYATTGMTEPLFISLILGSLLLLPNPKKSKLLTWVTCGLLIGACVFVRYSGVFLAFGTGAGLFTYLILYERRSISALIKPCFKLALLVSLPSMVFIYLMQRTYAIIGTLDRYSGTKIPETLASTARKWVVKSSELTGFTSMNPENGWMANLWFTIFIILVSSIVLIYLVGAIKHRTSSIQLSPSTETETEQPEPHSRVTYFRLVWLTSAFHGLALIIYLSISSLNTTPLEIITRYLYQIYPGFYAIFCFMLFMAFKRATSDKALSRVKTTTTILAVVYLAAQLNSVRATRPTYFGGSTSVAEMMNLTVHNSVTVKTFIERCFAADKTGNSKIGESIWSPHAQPIHLHTGIPTVSKSANYTDRPFDAAEFSNRIEQYQIGLFVFYDLTQNPADSHVTFMNSAKHWLTGNGYYPVNIQSNTFGENDSIEMYSANPQCDSS